MQGAKPRPNPFSLNYEGAAPTTARVTTLSVNYSADLHCYQVAIEANNGNCYLGKHKVDSMRSLINFIEQEIRILESTELEKGGDQNCM